MGRRGQRAGSFWRRLVRRDQELGSGGANSSDRARARTIYLLQEGWQQRGGDKRGRVWRVETDEGVGSKAMGRCRARVCEAGETGRDAAVEDARRLTARLAASLLGGLPLVARRSEQRIWPYMTTDGAYQLLVAEARVDYITLHC